MQELDILIEDPRWEDADIGALAPQAVGATLRHLKIDPELCTLSLLACDDARIAALNGDFREKPQPTNVLSWPAEDRNARAPGLNPPPPNTDRFGTIELGDIAISYETCQAEATAAGKPLAHHVTHLIVHGTLHLLGFDHIDDGDAALMEGLEVKILGKLGLDDPYRLN
ncbi:MAG: rRNA maturation RNase YbeY [Sulfitobacter sp.]|nr:rRNA maturation RNase YbeY [Sulfitobacter sp.]